MSTSLPYPKHLHVRKLHNGVYMPALGFGTFCLDESERTVTTVQGALDCGYLLLDSADLYKNQNALGKAVREWDSTKPRANMTREIKKPLKTFDIVSVKEFEDNFKVPHGEFKDYDENSTAGGASERKVFLTSKIWPSDFHSDEALMESFQRTCKALGRTPDLMLLHWPAPAIQWFPPEEQTNPKNPEVRIRCWKFMEKLYLDKKVRAIGVSNYMTKHLEPLLADIKARGGIVPMVNQIEISPYVKTDQDLIDLCAKEKIYFTAYSLLGASKQTALENEYLNQMAKKLDLTPNLMCLRWALQKGYMVIPRTTKVPHAINNFSCLDIEIPDDMMKEIDQCPPDVRACPDPHDIV